jgi:hypothetical protein
LVPDRRHQERQQEIRELIARLGLTCNEHTPKTRTCTAFEIHVSDTTDLVRDLFPERVLTPSFLAKLSHAELQALYSTMMAGDGTNGKNGQDSFCAVNPRQRDGFQTLCTLLGLATTTSLRPAADAVIVATGQVVHGGPYWIVHVKRRNKAQVNQGQREVRYVENTKVWCPVVLSGFFVARRKGFVFVTGNSMFQGLAADGAKEALHLIIKAAYRDPSSPLYGTRPSGFVHDEFIISCRAEQAERALPEVERLMVLGMSKWIPDVLIQAPGKIMTERWSK